VLFALRALQAEARGESTNQDRKQRHQEEFLHSPVLDWEKPCSKDRRKTAFTATGRPNIPPILLFLLLLFLSHISSIERFVSSLPRRPWYNLFGRKKVWGTPHVTQSNIRFASN
jgi:hypothetical protein